MSIATTGARYVCGPAIGAQPKRNLQLHYQAKECSDVNFFSFCRPNGLPELEAALFI